MTVVADRYDRRRRHREGMRDGLWSASMARRGPTVTTIDNCAAQLATAGRLMAAELGRAYVSRSH